MVYLALLLLLVAVLLVLSIPVAFLLAHMQLFFTFVKEGTVVYIVRGPSDSGTFSHCIMAFRGHYLNDPRSSNFDNTKPAWEVIRCQNANETPSAYRPGSIWRLYEHFGIYWFGLSPFYTVHDYVFRWTEPRLDDVTQKYKPMRREERTQIIYVSAFVYWLKLEGAEDRDNIPITLDYLLTIHINNPYLARFGVTDWLARLTADSNNAAKIWVGRNSFEDVVREIRGTEPQANSGFVEMIRQININAPTDHRDLGAPNIYGVTIDAASLQEVEIAGRNNDKIVESTTAKIVAENNARAAIATAEGQKQARIKLAEGDQKAIELVYSEVQKFGNLGILIQQLDAMSKANAAGGTIIWANNPFIGSSGLAEILQRSNLTPEDIIDFIKSRRGAAAGTTT